MKSLFIALLLLVFISCKKEMASTSNKQVESITKPLVKQDINIDYTITYLSPKAKPIVVNWKEYINVQNKIYELRKTNTVRIVKQLDELDGLFSALINSKFPEELKTYTFGRKLDVLEISILDLQNSIKNENVSVNDIEKHVYKILQEYEATKNQINAIYASL